MDNKHQYAELREKLIAGTNLAFQRLVEKAKLTDDYLVFSENGKVVKVMARSLDENGEPLNQTTSCPDTQHDSE